jgi:hypothetical protein
MSKFLRLLTLTFQWVPPLLCTPTDERGSRCVSILPFSSSILSRCSYRPDSGPSPSLALSSLAHGSTNLSSHSPSGNIDNNNINGNQITHNVNVFESNPSEYKKLLVATIVAPAVVLVIQLLFVMIGYVVYRCRHRSRRLSSETKMDSKSQGFQDSASIDSFRGLLIPSRRTSSSTASIQTSRQAQIQVQIDAMMAQIESLQAQQQSDWALEMTDEPPPSYIPSERE